MCFTKIKYTLQFGSVGAKLTVDSATSFIGFMQGSSNPAQPKTAMLLEVWASTVYGRSSIASKLFNKTLMNAVWKDNGFTDSGSSYEERAESFPTASYCNDDQLQRLPLRKSTLYEYLLSVSNAIVSSNSHHDEFK